MATGIVKPSIPERLDAGFFERLFEGAGLAIFACDAEGHILAWNSIGERMWNVRERDRVAADLRELLPEADRRVFEENLRTLLQTGEPLEFRTRSESAPGETREFAVWLAPLPAEE